MNLTLKDIARELGISVTTVSKALKDYKDVSPKTKARVRAYAEKVHFKPNIQASFLRTRITKLIGLILPVLRNDFYSCVMEQMITQLEKEGYHLLVLCSNESFVNEQKQIKTLLQLQVDGIFLSVANETNSFEHLKEVLNQKVSLILFDRMVKLFPTYQVVIEEVDASYEAVCHLIQQGCKSIAHLRGPLTPQYSIDRFLGYKKALESHKFSFDKELVSICNSGSFSDGYKNTLLLLEKRPDIDAIFAIDDGVAAGALFALNTIGCQVPEEVALVGFSNWMSSSLLTPRLSTVEQNGKLMGEKVVTLFLELQKKTEEHKPLIFTKIIIPAQLMIRSSSMKKGT